MLTWDGLFTKILYDLAEKSQDRSSKYAAVCVDEEQRILSTGYNGIPRGMPYEERYHSRPDKYMYFIHAEMNCILNAAAVGVPLRGSTMYVIHPPCAACAGCIVNARISQIVYVVPWPQDDSRMQDPTWRAGLTEAANILRSSRLPMRRANIEGAHR